MKLLSLVVALFAVLAACGQVEPVLLSVSMPDCTYRGPSTMREGEASLSLTLNGIGDARVVLVELAGTHRYDELAVHFASSPEWVDRPDWIEPILDVELSDTAGASGDVDTDDLAAGHYAVICVDQTNGTARVSSRFEVGG